jgi:hypothetical protein
LINFYQNNVSTREIFALLCLVVLGALEHKLADSELWSGAGLCCIAIARCQQSLANAHAEAEALAQAARYYAKVILLLYKLRSSYFNGPAIDYLLAFVKLLFLMLIYNVYH